MPNVVVARTALRRGVTRWGVQRIGIIRGVVDGMRPGVREQRLQTIRQAMAVLGLKGVVALCCAVPLQIELSKKVGVRLVIYVLAHELAAARTHVDECEDIGARKTLLYRRIPFVGSG